MLALRLSAPLTTAESRIIEKKVSMPLVHGIAALIFAILGSLTPFNVGNLF